MFRTDKTFRVFVSSTFSDLKAERDALQAQVFPRLRDLCERHGAHFQAIDLRWGVSQQASRDQQTMDICLREIARCQEVTPRPNFIVLLGDRYGWCPPPAQIPAGEFEQLLKKVIPEKKALLEQWYRRDNNAIPPEYCLQPRKVGGPFESSADWQPVEQELHDILLEAARASGIDREEFPKYSDSATHQEISAGALSVPDAEDHVLCFFRNIQDLPEDPIARSFRDFRDVKGEIRVDLEAHGNLLSLRETLRNRLGKKNVYEYRAHWETDQPSRDHIDQLCRDVYQGLKRIILLNFQQAEQISASAREQKAQQLHLEELTHGFQGCETILDALQKELDERLPTPIILWGSPGSGKTAVLAKFVHQYQNKKNDTELFFRFAGATTTTSNAALLISGLCEEIQERFNFAEQKAARLAKIPRQSEDFHKIKYSIEQEYHIPTDLRGLLDTFNRFLEIASREMSLTVVIDGLDILDKSVVSKFIRSLPAELPPRTNLLLSFSPGDALEQIQARFPLLRKIKLEPFSRNLGKQILNGWLINAHRDLQDWQKQRILDNFLAGGKGLPLYLRLAFEQACRWKSYFDPDHIVLGSDIDQMIDNLFDQLSTNENHGYVLVSRTIAYLSTSRWGLSEDELLDLLSNDAELYSWFIQNLYHIPSDLKKAIQTFLMEGDIEGKIVDDMQVTAWLEKNRKDPKAIQQFLEYTRERKITLRLPIVLWSRLFADLRPYLVLREGDGTNLLRISFQYLKEQSKSRFLPNVDAKLLHHRMATFFSEQRTFLGDGVINRRKLSELPYQQTRGSLYDSLKETLMEFEFLDTKIQVSGPESAIEDFRRAETSGYIDETLQTIQGALELSAHVLELDPRQLPSQLTGRLSAIKKEEIQTFLVDLRNWKGRPWLRPISSSLISPGGALVRKYSEYQGRHIGLSDGSILIGKAQGDLCQFSCIDNLIKGEFLHQGKSLQPLKLGFDGREILIREGDYRLGIIDSPAAETLNFIGEAQEKIKFAARIPGSSIIMISTSDGKLEAWDMETSQNITLLPGESSSVAELLPVRDQQFVISVHWDGTVKHWGFSSTGELNERESFTIPLTSGCVSITAASLSAGDSGLLIGFGDGTIGFFDLVGEKLSKRFKIHSEWVTALTIFPEGNLCLSGAFDGSLIVWDVESGTQLASYEGHNAPIESITILPDASGAISSTNYELRYWDLSSSDNSRQGENVTALALTPDGKKVVAASDTRYALSRVDADTILSVLDLATGQVESRVDLGRHFWVNDLDIFNDNRRVMCACMYRNKSLLIFDLKNGKPILPLPFNKSSFTVKIWDQGSRVISGGEDNTIRIWDLDSFSEVACLRGHTDEITALCVYDGGNKALSAARDHTLRIWDLESYQELKVITPEVKYLDITDIQVMNSGKFALSSGGGIRLWDLEQGSLVNSFPLETRSGSQMPWTEGDLPLISGTNRNRFSVFDPGTGELIANFWGEGDGMRHSVAAPDGSTFAVGGNSGSVHILELIKTET